MFGVWRLGEPREGLNMRDRAGAKRVDLQMCSG